MKPPIRVSLRENSYDIRFGPAAALPAALKKLGFSSARLFLITSQAVKGARHAGGLARALTKNGFHVTVSVLPNGERHKTLATVARLYREALRVGLDRKALVVAVGGGVVTDLAGFFAATYLRGLPYVSVPTTLLAMVDAAIGGKTGVDLPEGKNLAGAFYQPRLVWIDPGVLKTLPEREWRTGFAEIIKYGVIKDRAFFQWLEKRVRARPNPKRWLAADVEKAIHVSAAIKARVVSADERETPLKGGREILNFGHTVGHALEAATGYSALSHGQAISIGMGVAGRISLSTGHWSDDEQLQLLSLLEAVGLPIRFPRLDASRLSKFWAALKRDKKHIGGRLRFVLPHKLGHVEVRSVPITVLRSSCFPAPASRSGRR